MAHFPKRFLFEKNVTTQASVTIDQSNVSQIDQIKAVTSDQKAQTIQSTIDKQIHTPKQNINDPHKLADTNIQSSQLSHPITGLHRVSDEQTYVDDLVDPLTSLVGLNPCGFLAKLHDQQKTEEPNESTIIDMSTGVEIWIENDKITVSTDDCSPGFIHINNNLVVFRGHEHGKDFMVCKTVIHRAPGTIGLSSGKITYTVTHRTGHKKSLVLGFPGCQLLDGKTVDRRNITYR